MLRVLMAAPTTGWVSVGFDPASMMAEANILIGYVKDGAVFLRDDYGNGQVKHEADKELGGTEDFSDLQGEEENGQTIIRFNLPLDSGDKFDKALKQGERYKVIYAFGPDGKDDFGTYHTKNRGSFEITL